MNRRIPAGFSSHLACLAAVLLCCPLASAQAEQQTIDDALTRIFSELPAPIEDSISHVVRVDLFNNAQIYPRVKTLLVRDFFRFFQVNLLRPCPFWKDIDKCSQTTCRVRCCKTGEVPSVLQPQHSDNPPQSSQPEAQDVDEQTSAADCDSSEEQDLGRLDTTVPQARRDNLGQMAAEDSARGQFCQLDDERDEQLEFVDLTRNPERYTGYRGDSARRIWAAIYQDNCLRLDTVYDPLKAASSSPSATAAVSGSTSRLGGLQCLEERAFYKAVSGLHSSITVHLCAVSLLSESCGALSTLVPSSAMWGANPAEFARRFDPHTTWGQGPTRLRNLYFIYLLELRALQKAAPLLRKMLFVDGDSGQTETRRGVMDLLDVIDQFDGHFDESVLFVERPEARLEFSQNFRNISRIMDCVSCDKCKLWGKLQTQGLGTALKVLFSGHFDRLSESGSIGVSDVRTFLSRNEVVALFNAFGRLSTSIQSLETFSRRSESTKKQMDGRDEL